MAAGEGGKLAGVALVLEVRDEEDDGAAALGGGDEAEGGADVGAFVRLLGGEDFADEALDGGAAFARGEAFHHAVGEEDEADFVLVGEGGQGQEGGELGGAGGLGTGGGAEALAAGDVDEEEDGELALLAKAFDVGLAHAGGDVPIDGADVVAGLVGAGLVELDAAALEDGVVVAAEAFVEQTPGEDADPPHFLHQFFGVDLHIRPSVLPQRRGGRAKGRARRFPHLSGEPMVAEVARPFGLAPQAEGSGRAEGKAGESRARLGRLDPAPGPSLRRHRFAAQPFMGRGSRRGAGR